MNLTDATNLFERMVPGGGIADPNALVKAVLPYLQGIADHTEYSPEDLLLINRALRALSIHFTRFHGPTDQLRREVEHGRVHQLRR